MSIDLEIAYTDCRGFVSLNYRDVVRVDRQLELPERRESTVRPIGEILPLVMARYGIDDLDSHELTDGSRARDSD